MRRMGIEERSIIRTRTPTRTDHKIYPYLLRSMEVTRPNQVWAMDITYIPMAHGFVYLAVVWTGRHVVFCRGGCRSRWRRPSASRPWKMPWLATASRTSSTLPISRLSVHRPPRPSPACSPAMASPSAWIAKGLSWDNVFVERLWRSVKYEEVYLRAYETVGEARSSIGRYLQLL